MYTERLRWVRKLNFAASRAYFNVVSGPIGLSVWCGAKGLNHVAPEIVDLIERSGI